MTTETRQGVQFLRQHPETVTRAAARQCTINHMPVGILLGMTLEALDKDGKVLDALGAVPSVVGLCGLSLRLHFRADWSGLAMRIEFEAAINTVELSMVRTELRGLNEYVDAIRCIEDRLVPVPLS